jgi:hypothetical protein
VRDSNITAGMGFVGGDPPLVIRRTKIQAETGLWAIGGALNAGNVLITPHPRASNQYTFTGIEALTSNSGKSSTVEASNVTIDGHTATGYRYGIYVTSANNPNVTTGAATATVMGAIIHSVNTALLQDGDSATETATINIAYSSYDGSATASNGFGGIFYGGGNLNYNPDPRFVNPGAGDYRLRWDSPLLDLGRPTAFLAEEDPDLAGHQRVRDSDGNSSAIRDIGAYEYQRMGPDAAIAITPAQALLGTPMAFDASASRDPDGDPLAFSWAFGDGATGSGASAPHTFGASGLYQVSVTATDPTGLTSTATQAAGVEEPPVQPSQTSTQPQPNQPGADHIAPVLSGLRLSPKIFTARRGSRVSYRLSEQAKLTLVLERAQRRNGRLVFTRYARTARAGTAGANRMMLRRKLGSRRLAPGQYRLTLVARDAAANRSNAVRAKFTVRR